MMTDAFPHQYKVGLRWDGEKRGLLSAPPRPDILAGPPPQFGGQDQWWSPEHLLIGSAALCLMATFLALAAKARLELLAYRCDAEGTLDRAPAGLVMTSIALRVSLRVREAEKDRAKVLLETAKRHCIVANSLKTPVTLEALIESAQAGALAG